MTDEGVALLERFEGFRGLPYKDSAGKLTIGIGTLLPLTRAEAALLLAHRLRPMEEAIGRLVTVPLTPTQADVLASLVYNIGVGAFRRSTLLRRLNAGDYAAVPAELAKWTKAGGRVVRGLVTRRAAEAALWRVREEPPWPGALVEGPHPNPDRWKP